MSPELMTSLGDELYTAYSRQNMLCPLTSRHPDISIENAYQIQQHFIDLRLLDGEKIIGKKVGVTSQAVMDLLGVSDPDFGQILDGMICNSNETISIDRLIQPRIEGEIAFILKHDLCGPGINAADVLRATEGVMACFEIVDSRIEGWKIAIQDTVADNASCGLLMLGDRMVSPCSVDLRTCGMVMSKNGQVAVTGAGAATMGSPVTAMVWLANTLGRLGMSLKAGDLVLSGALGAMLPVVKGDSFTLEINGIGRCSTRFQ